MTVPASGRPGLDAEPAGPHAAPVLLGLPDPPLADRDAGIVLRPWRPTDGDVAALVTAWTDPRLVAANGAPAEVSADRAARWIRGEPARRAAGSCLDLVVAPAGVGIDGSAVLGEVGLRNIDHDRRRAEIGWWIAADHRGRGLAIAAVRLLVDWALSASGGFVQVWARIDRTNEVSCRVARSAGFVELGEADGSLVWSRTPDPA